MVGNSVLGGMGKKMRISIQLGLCATVVVVVALIDSVHADTELQQNMYKSYTDYGQAEMNPWTKATGDVFTATQVDRFNFSYSSPQSMIFRVGYDTTRVEALSIKCETVWGCYKSQVNLDSEYYGHKPAAMVCIDVPNGNYAQSDIRLFAITLRAKQPLDTRGGWWLSTQAYVAPGTCVSNPTAEGFARNSIDGSSSCGGIWQACDTGADPGISEYVGFGPPNNQGDDRGDQGTVSGNEGSGAVNIGNASTGSGGGAVAQAPAPVPLPLPAPAPQGDAEDQPKIEPSPFFDGKEYKKQSDPDTAVAGVSTRRDAAQSIWTYIGGGLGLVALVGGVIVWRRRL